MRKTVATLAAAVAALTIDASIESHVIDFKAEKSRLSMKKVEID